MDMLNQRVTPFQKPINTRVKRHKEELKMSDAMAAQVLSGLIFFSFAYYVAWIPYRDKKAGKEVPSLLWRVKTDLANLWNKIRG
jgi:hypothetical protein